MPIYEFACPKCRVIYSFLSKKVNPDHLPQCPKCGNREMRKQMSRFALPKGVPEPTAAGPGDEEPLPDIDEGRMERAMSELERDMEHMDENNPRHMAHMMKKMKDFMPPGVVPKELDVAIKRLEKGRTRRRSRRTWAMSWETSSADPRATRTRPTEATEAVVVGIAATAGSTITDSSRGMGGRLEARTTTTEPASSRREKASVANRATESPATSPPQTACG
ncbi:MAG: zinc ribbon domain-containing protein [Verrucomicrobia bacterium]|nr:zinc ribbon domain-containing protein [Verrucomicrobiota bacterium]